MCSSIQHARHVLYVNLRAPGEKGERQRERQRERGWGFSPPPLIPSVHLKSRASDEVMIMALGSTPVVSRLSRVRSQSRGGENFRFLK